MEKILIIEDDKRIASFVARRFQQSGYAVELAHDGEEGLRLAVANLYSVAVVDLMMPKMSGLTFISELRRRNIEMPVIILSAKRSVPDRIKGLSSGGDDYLTKPFAFAELLARVQALIRRDSRTTDGETLRVADLSIDLLSRTASRGQRRIELQPREFALLEYLARNHGRILSKKMILETVWDYDFDPQTNVVDVLVCRLRSKLDNAFAVKLLQTIRGAGYVLREPERS